MTTAVLPRLRTVRLYGRLGSRFGRSFRLAVNSPAEAVRALCVQIKGFEQWLMESKDHGVAYAVFIGKRNLAEDELDTPPGGEDIRIAPIIIGAKEGGWFQIILGAALIAAGVFISGMSFGLAAPIGQALIGMGVSMIVGGVVQLLAPSPKGGTRDRPENTPSYAFNGPVNTQAQGNPVPVLYGELIIGSAVISAGIQADDEVYIPDATTTPTGGGTGGGGSPPWHLDWLDQQ
jgi:predicted phage tail protein